MTYVLSSCPQREGSSLMILVDSQQEVLQHAEWIGKSGEALALAKNNDLYYKVPHTLCMSIVNLREGVK